MIPTKQRVSYFWQEENNPEGFTTHCDNLIKEGWIIHQVIPQGNTGNFYLILYKY